MKKFYLLLSILVPLSLQSQVFDYYGPQPFGKILNHSFNKPWNPQAISSIENRSYVVILDESQSMALMLDENDIYTVGLNPVEDVYGSSSTYGSVVRSIFQFVDLNAHKDNNKVPLAGQYRVNPFLHSYYSLGIDDSENLVCSDGGTMQIAESTEQGFLVIETSGATSSAKIKAVSHWEYDSNMDTVSEASGWTNRWLQNDNGSLSWTTDESSASSFFLASVAELIDLEIEDGSDFNPLSVAYQPNASADLPDDVYLIEDSKFYSELPNKVNDESKAQFGNSSEATSAASEMLDEIEATLTDKGKSLRYPKEFYLALRENMLSQEIASNDIYGARVGYNNIVNVYFTNASDDDGEPHPFMIVVAFAVSSRPNMLIDVNRPPGATPGAGYAESTVTRFGKLGDFVIKIPLKDYGLISDLLGNDLSPYGDLASAFDDDHGTTTEKTVYNYAGLASVGMAVDGVTIYPAMNNNIRFTVEDGEITQSGIHVGGGLELHYHADGHAFSQNGINLYNISDYEGHDHPPVIGMAYDGIALFARYESSYSSMAGYNVGLDEFGGHDHGDGFGYHYHAHAENHVSSNNSNISFTEHFLLVGAWKGNINSIPGFDEGKMNQFDETDIARYVGASDNNNPPPPGEPLGFKDQSQVIYPNPSNGAFKLITNFPYKLYVFDLKGKLVWSGVTDGTLTNVSLEGVAKGTYILRGVSYLKTFQRKVIVD